MHFAESLNGIRIAGISIALAFGIGVPAFLLGPMLFDGAPLSVISSSALTATVAFGIFGAWLLLVSYLAPVDEVKKVLEPFQAGEAVVLFLPYMLVVGTRSMWRRFAGGKEVQVPKRD